MARPAGFEPTTCSFGGCHSIQLSYGRKARKITRTARLPRLLVDSRGGLKGRTRGAGYSQPRRLNMT